MAFRTPGFMVPIRFHYQGSVDDLTDVVLGFIHFDCEIMFIDYVVEDANDTFDETDITLEYDTTTDGSTYGDDTVIDVITVPAASGTQAAGFVDPDDLTEGTITLSRAQAPYGARILLTAEDVSTYADTGIQLTFWVVPTDLT